MAFGFSRWRRSTLVAAERGWVIGDGTLVNTEGVTDAILDKVSITAGSDCDIDIRGLVTINGELRIFMTNSCSIAFGQGTQISGALRCYLHESSSIEIGEWCLFAGGDLWTSDMHSILDQESGERINSAKDIHVGNRVWVGQDALILKGSTIGSDSVVGAKSLVAGDSFPANVVVAGIPAKVVRSGVAWDIRLL